MIDVIGKKRFLFLSVLAGTCAFLGFLVYVVLQPQSDQKQQLLNSIKSEVSSVQTDVQNMQQNFVTFENQKLLFEKLSKMGFLNDQNRVEARARFEILQKLSKIISARYEIKAADIVEDESTKETGFVMMKSPISITISALDDLDVYRFIYYLNYGYPGHIKIKDLSIERKLDATPDNLKIIGTGTPPEMISARMELDWTTMAKKDSIPSESLKPVSGDQGAVAQ